MERNSYLIAKPQILVEIQMRRKYGKYAVNTESPSILIRIAKVALYWMMLKKKEIILHMVHNLLLNAEEITQLKI